MRVGGYISGAAEVAGGVAVALPTKSNFTRVYQALIFMLLVHREPLGAGEALRGVAGGALRVDVAAGGAFGCAGGEIVIRADLRAVGE